MKRNQLCWENVEHLKSHHITFLLYREGKSIKTIALIRNMEKQTIENEIIKAKLEFNIIEEKQDFLINLISMNKKERSQHIDKLSHGEKEELIEEIKKRYTTFKNPEDRSIIIWVIGELKDQRLLPYLRMELKSNMVNQRRLACSAIGKMKAIEAKSWLEDELNDHNPQVKQYAIKALGSIGDKKTIPKLTQLYKNVNEREYVRRAALEAIKMISSD